MKLSEFSVEIPDSLIANYPTEPRDGCRLMVCHLKDKRIEHRTFRDILEYFDEGDVMILNDTKVFPARLLGKKEKTGASIEVFLLRELNKRAKLWDVLVDPARKIRVGNKLFFGENELVAEVVDNTTSRGRTIRFLFDGTDEELNQMIDTLGKTPIPPYISREVEDRDRDDYQTIYAKHVGAVAAPTAGLHFTRELLKRFELKGVEQVQITLHTGLGTFQPVEVEDLSKHRMDSEYFEIDEKICEIVNAAKVRRNKVLAVGTTTMRALESSVSAGRMLKPQKGWTDRFIYPPYDFNIANAMLTNFHRPKSTLMMMVSAFMGYDFMMKCYEEAVKEEYRFFSYGDAMLIID
ncbi:MAG: tRNA preQ1(34) S-adenosylmethionine ribosyltransferase-isomerase QueA [Bacteroidetes bacterium]|nr:tRNA preQ1(34) S-adenosylmethionine ribosyltransferase-isomerase QueA [Bacteroidota bacterium]MBL0015403.1 tRNA preQ1(34) S-adenosylmethionine ribosyltransferase-isomerase QueA [Bacteroidota bacterium]MBP6639767.1 tRNA preQ1(34) S-adenosylmethionine ribosyltransferase-isomerase QueA [Bacteroidia bacterium]MBP6722384.1 tRNA preQ1(34) S-adenosylmethionine ribosyltransferase-isomerase QueA [Bacteroidia bacterium]MBP8073714.1 tRNA preQ1(34) S-adenosylmethionine ribosyltransferase-isomerase QueA 